MEEWGSQTLASHVKAVVPGEGSGPNVYLSGLNGWLLRE